MLVGTCLQIKKQKEILIKLIVKKQMIKNLSVNVRNCALSLKIRLIETLLSLQKKMMEKRLMLLKFQRMMIHYMMFGMYKTIKKFLKNRDKFLHSLTTDDDRKMMIPRKSSTNFKNCLQ